MTESAGVDRRADHRGHGNLGSITGTGAASPKYALGVRLRRVVLELGVLAQERELQVAGWAVALLGDDDIRDAFARRVLFVHLFSIDQQNHVSVLFNRTTFPKIRHHRLLLHPLLDTSVVLLL